MTIETEYRGYTIRYSENEDVWRCYDLGSGKDHESPSLSKVKQKIDRILLAERKESATPCLVPNSYRSTNMTDANVIEYLGPKIDGGGYGGKPRRVADHGIAVVAQVRGQSKKTRTTTTLSKVVAITPETDAAIKRAQIAQQEADAAVKRAQEAFEAIPRLTLDDIADLVRISGIDPTGGLKEKQR